MKIFKIFAIALVGVLTVGCYNDFDTPAPLKTYGDADMAEMGLTHVTIKTVKDKFNTLCGGISNTGTNKDWASTQTVKFGELNSSESATHIKAWAEAANFYIKGKVLSDDREGNIYKSLFIYDGTAAIEIKLTNSNYLKYKQGQWVYIKLSDLYLGNYRMMLSIGEGPTSSYNSMGEEKFYANSNIENPTRLREHVFIGELDGLTSDDIVVVTKSNYASFSQNIEANLGRLVRFEGLTCYYAGVENQNGETHPVLKNGSYDQIYPSWIDTDTRNPVVTKPWYKWAFNHKGVCLYGSVCFTYLDDIGSTTTPHYTSDHGIYIVRTSGYSQFAGRQIVKDGAKGNITAIFGIYSQRSNFKGGSGDYATYQLSVSDYADLEFEAGDYLSEDEVLALTPDGYDETGVYNSDKDSYFVPSKNTGDRED